VAEQLLHGADVVAALEQMRRKRVPQRVAAHRLDDASEARRALDDPRQGISLAGWLISSSGTAAPYTVFFAVLGLILLSAGIVLLHRRIERRIDRIKEL